MAITLFCIVIMTMLGIRELVQRDESLWANILNVAIAVLVGVVIGGIVGIGVASLVGIPFEQEMQESNFQLASLRSSDGVDGNFFLGTGTIEGASYYFFYQEVGSALVPGKIKADRDVAIYEEQNRSDGRLVILRPRFKRAWIQPWAVSWTATRYEFHVPAGSVKRNFGIY